MNALAILADETREVLTPAMIFLMRCGK